MHYMTPPVSADLGEPISDAEYAQIIDAIIQQPQWRAQADREADYMDGNQLSSALLAQLEKTGIPPAKENIIGPAIAALCGYEAKTRTDWRITPDGQPGGQEVADALNFRLNQAERQSKADAAMSDAFKPQIAVGLGWVEVARSSDPFAFKFRCRYVHRNEIFWQMEARERDLSDCAWLVRERFVKRQQAQAAFPQAADLIAQADQATTLGGWGGYLVDGGTSTGLMAGAEISRAWTRRESAWYRGENDEVCISELWYRRWVAADILRLRGGRVVEFDADNPMHQAAVASGQGRLERATVARVRRAYWLGPFRLFDGPTPYPHPHFPYVPFWGYREDMTGAPFGLVRDMMFPQDNLNSTLAKLRWGMAAVRVERTDGAVNMTDDQLRRQIARPDADVVLNAKHFRENPGARFEVKRDFQLNAQQFQLMADSRAALERVSGITAAMQGRMGTARSGLQEQTQLEQSQVSVADLMDSFKESRTMVGELLLAMEIEDLGQEQTSIIIEGDVLNPPREVVLNRPEVDPDTGLHYLSNDVQRTRLKVALEDVPTSSSFRAQQLATLSEAVKALPPETQQVMMPFMVDLMDLPRKAQVVEAIRKAQQQPDPQQMREQIRQELMHDLKERELALKERIGEAQVEKLMRDAVQVGVTSAFAAMQAGEKIALNPAVAPIGDIVMKQSGWQPPSPAGQDPNFPTPAQAMPVQNVGGMPGDTSPITPKAPAQPQSAAEGAEGGIQTLRKD